MHARSTFVIRPCARALHTPHSLLYGEYVAPHTDHTVPLSPGVDFRLCTLPIDGKQSRLHLWDTTGAARFSKITHAYYRVSQGIIVVYDSTDPAALDHVGEWCASPAALWGEVEPRRVFMHAIVAHSHALTPVPRPAPLHQV